ncbi:MAG: hypothetical protein IT373_05620 [Polyangiaceae bacterium]|nr:hypothetical protein [Polyangiaceae bacterium]
MPPAPLGQHIVMRLREDRVLAPTVEARRAFARAVLRVAEPFALLATRASDTHVHLLVACPEPEARELGRRLGVSLRRVLALPTPFERARLRPVHDQWHLASAFRYVLGQHAHHGIGGDELFEASNLPDLLGMRLLGAHATAHVRGLLPRVGRTELLALLGVPDLDEPRAIHPDDLPDAAAGAVGLPDLAGLSAPVVAARRAALAVAAALSVRPAPRASAPQTTLASALGVHPRTLRQLARSSPDRRLVHAVLLQLRARAAVRARGGWPPDSEAARAAADRGSRLATAEVASGRWLPRARHRSSPSSRPGCPPRSSSRGAQGPLV